MSLPILYSFRRCPYAMRARLALDVSVQRVELREVVLRDKPQDFLDTSPSATVPCLKDSDQIIDESFDIMLWALKRNDPEHWLNMPGVGFDLVTEADGPFETALDRYKYAGRHADADAEEERHKGGLFLHKLNKMLEDKDYLFGQAPTFADMAILPFVRQFAHVDLDWFNDQPWPDLSRWLEAFKSSPRFAAIMTKFPQWHPGDPITIFPDQS